MKDNSNPDQQKLRYLIPDSLNKLSETLNSLSLYSPNLSRTDIADKVKTIWKIEKPYLMERCAESIVLAFEKKFMDALLKTDNKKWLDSVNGAIDPYRRQADVGLAHAKRDIIDAWKSISESKIKNADISWLRHLNLGENFARFLEKDQRYIFTGFTNQAILGVALDSQKRTFESIVVSKIDLDKMLLHDFRVNYDIPTPIGIQHQEHLSKRLAGIPSLTSIFVPKETVYWITENGKKWIREDGSTHDPSQVEARYYNLTKKSNVSYISQPVWSLSSVSHLLSVEAQQKLEKLRDIRGVDSSYIDVSESKTLEDAIDQVIRTQIKKHAMLIMQKSNRAAYWPAKDKMAISSAMHFSNPVERYSNWTRELAKSTRHLSGRNPLNLTDSLDYMKEEIVAETTSQMMIRDLQEILQKQHPNLYKSTWKAQFEKFYEDFKGDVPRYDSGVSFNEAFNTLLNDRNAQSLLNDTMSNVLNALQISKTGRVHGNEITASLRQSKLKENMRNNAKIEASLGKSDAIPPASNLVPSDMDKIQLRALDASIEAITERLSNNPISNPEKKYALNQIKNVVEDLNGHIQDRLLKLIAFTYEKPFNKNPPYDMDYNYYTETTLTELYEELSLHLSNDTARFRKLVKMNSPGDTLSALKYYHGTNVDLIISLAEARAVFEENEISEMRVNASYSNDPIIYKEINRCRGILDRLYEQIENTKIGFAKSVRYMEKQKDGEKDFGLS